MVPIPVPEIRLFTRMLPQIMGSAWMWDMLRLRGVGLLAIMARLSCFGEGPKPLSPEEVS